MAIVAIAAAITAAFIPVLGHALLAERDLRARTHAGALARFHLDALLGRTAIEAHGAGAALEREHEALLSEWAGATQAAQRASIVVEGVQMAVGFGLTAWMLFSTTAPGGGGLLLQLYWMLNLPALGYELALIAREYPAHRTTIVRLLEPLATPDERAKATEVAGEDRATASAVEIAASGVSVTVGGQRILDGIDFRVPAGTHVAVIGASGAGKSTLAGVLLGWHPPAAGELRVDDRPLTPERLDALRRETAWVDPTVQIWNRPLIDNLLYGSDRTDRVSAALDKAGLLPVVAKLPHGLATRLGEGGALLSAGEAQRVRLGRAMVRDGVRLVILDEPFIGLERDRRRALLTQSRQHWHDTTLFYVTHDVAETRAFDRVIVLDHGRIVEDGNPIRLAQLPSSRYRRMLQAQELAQSRFAAAEWRRLRLDEGRVVQDHLATSEHRA
jgi:ATP-binding cassette subfamily B protein